MKSDEINGGWLIDSRPLYNLQGFVHTNLFFFFLSFFLSLFLSFSLSFDDYNRVFSACLDLYGRGLKSKSSLTWASLF